MGFSRELGSPEMVIIGRSITGLHSGGCSLGCAQPFPMAQSPTAISRRMDKALYSPQALWRGSWYSQGHLQGRGVLTVDDTGHGWRWTKGLAGYPSPCCLCHPSPFCAPRYLSQCGAPLPGRNRSQEPAGLSGTHAQHLHLPGGFLCPGLGPPRAAGQGEHSTPAHTCWALLCPPHDTSHFNSSQDRFWPLFLSVVVVPASLQLLLLHCFPESPRYLLIERNDVCGATKGERISWGGLAPEGAWCFSRVFQDHGAPSWHSSIPDSPLQS